MPPEGNPAPSAGEVALLRFWIARGAKEDQLLRDALPPAEARSALEHALSRAAVPLPGSEKQDKPAESKDDEEVDSVAKNSEPTTLPSAALSDKEAVGR